jgi:hypothetical protein
MPAKSLPRTRKSKDPCLDFKRKLKQHDADLKEARAEWVAECAQSAQSGPV